MSTQTKIQTFEGNVGIGTNNPGGFRLDVNTGTVSTSAIEVTNFTVGSVTNAFLPIGSIVMWHRALNSIPSGWQICDGTSGTPDLRNFFVIGSETNYTQGDTGGDTSFTLADENLPSHSHSTPATSTDANHTHPNATTTQGGRHRHTGTTATSPTHTHNSDISSSSGSHGHNYNAMNSSGLHSHPFSVAPNGIHAHRAGPRVIWDASNGSCGIWSNHPAVAHSLARQPANTTRYQTYTSYGGDHGHGSNTSNYSGNHNHNASFPTSGNHSHPVTCVDSANHTHPVGIAGNTTNHNHVTTMSTIGAHTHSYTTNSTGQGQAFSIMPSYYTLAYIMKTS